MPLGELADYMVDYYPVTGDVIEPNPIPERARIRRAALPHTAANNTGIGRIDWDKVTAYSDRDIVDFARKMEIGSLLATNAKTLKPRPSGKIGIIRGLNLSPHFYANLLDTTPLTPSGALSYVDRLEFNAFNGRTRETASKGSGIPQKELLNLCTGSSKYCRQTCLVTTGQHPSTLQAAHAKMKFTYAFLDEPELFVAVLNKQLKSFGHSAEKRGYDAVVRLNMLCDLPWYAMCPELIESLEGSVTFYDYTKLKYWDDPDYQRVEHLLDLTYSFAGGNDKLCAEALNAGERVAVCFAPGDPARRATVAARTNWQEILDSGLVNAAGNVSLFGGEWPIVDGDESDYRIDDPQPSIVALNFKEPTIDPDKAEHLKEAVPESRKHFAIAVPDVEGRGQTYNWARNKKVWRDLGIDVNKIPVEEVLRLAIDDDRQGMADAADIYDARKNPQFKAPDPSEPMTLETHMPMAPIEGTDLLLGPHVPTVLND